MIAISLFSGIGGLDIGFSAAGFDIIAQVENEPFCQRILTRHKSEWWPNATIFADVRDFGIADLPGIKPGDIAAIFGGFPCQPHSDAGKKLGADDPRNLWPDFRRIISEFRPRTLLLENVPGILSGTGYAITVIENLTEMGYDAKWGTIQAADTGAPHKRERWFCVAYDNGQRELQQSRDVKIIRKRVTHTDSKMGNTQSTRLPQYRSIHQQSPGAYREAQEGRVNSRYNRPNRIIQKRRQQRVVNKSQLVRTTDGIPTWLDKPRWPAGQGTFQYDHEQPRTIGKGIDKNRSSRIKALGNAVLPQIAYPIACQIMDFIRRHYV